MARSLARRMYPRENPLSTGLKVGLAVGGVALAGTVAYLVYANSTATTGTVAFRAADFSVAGSPINAPNNTTANMSGGGFNVTLARSMGTSLTGSYTFNTASTALGTVTFTVTQGDGTANYPAGTVITGVPNAYLGQP